MAANSSQVIDFSSRFGQRPPIEFPIAVSSDCRLAMIASQRSCQAESLSSMAHMRPRIGAEQAHQL